MNLNFYHGYKEAQNEQTLLNQLGFFFLAMASVVPKPARIPAVATVARKIPPANKGKTSMSKVIRLPHPYRKK